MHDSESILEIERAPDSMLVIGGGSFGCEYASIFAAIGTRVTVVDAARHLLPALDVEMAASSPSRSTSMGIRRDDRARTCLGVAREGGTLEARLADGGTLKAEKVLVAAGRRPHIEGLGLAEAGVEIDAAGWVRSTTDTRPPLRACSRPAT